MTFALVTEGISEHKITKHIILKYFKEFNPIVNQIQPVVLNDKQEAPGGWVEVLKYCEREDLKDILSYNDFLIFQIDSDQSETAPFSISHLKEGVLKSVEDLHTDILQKLISQIKPDILEKYRGNIFFAICIHTIECWLLPLYLVNNNAKGTVNCLNRLNSEITKKNIRAINSNDKNSHFSRKSYEEILKSMKRATDIEEISVYNYGFDDFVKSLKKIKDQRTKIDAEIEGQK